MTRALSLFTLLLTLATSVSAAEALRFPAFGDWGMGKKIQKKIADSLDAHCKKYHCDFVMGLGDNFYPAGVESTTDAFWEDRYESVYGERLNIPFMASLGNHDYGGNVQAQVDYSGLSKTWRLPARYHSYKKGIAEFFVIDTNAFKGEQVKWLKEGLAASTAKWIFVYGHHPIYSYGDHGDSQELQKTLLPILKKGRANFYVAGHDHDLQVLKEEDGVNFIVSGAASENRRTRKGTRTIWKSDELGFAYFVATDTVVSARMIDKNGATLFEKDYTTSVRR